MFDLFGWLRRRSREAVLGGVADAVSQIEAGDGPPDLDRLRALLAPADKALPAAGGEEPAKKGRAKA